MTTQLERRGVILAGLILLFTGIPFGATPAEKAPSIKIFIEPQDGFESYIAAAIFKKKVPAVVTQNRDDAEFVMTSKVTSNPESTGSKIARCIFAYCAGINGDQTATVQLINAKGEVTWAYNVKKGGHKNFQSSSEAIAKHLKNYLERPPKK
ncbi:MAG: hypothetical protein LAQ30_11515 [Acidobacteriia bacterium]|nr:hypothetical protein [Terriglobia bacterium]